MDRSGTLLTLIVLRATLLREMSSGALLQARMMVWFLVLPVIVRVSQSGTGDQHDGTPYRANPGDKVTYDCRFLETCPSARLIFPQISTMTQPPISTRPYR